MVKHAYEVGAGGGGRYSANFAVLTSVKALLCFDGYRRIPKVSAHVTFRFSRRKGPLLSGSRYFRMVKKRFYSNSRFRQSGHVTQEIKHSVNDHLCRFSTTPVNRADCVDKKGPKPVCTEGRKYNGNIIS